MRAGAFGNSQLCCCRLFDRDDGILVGSEFRQALFGVGLLFHCLELAIIQLVAMRVECFDLVVQRLGLAGLGDDLQLLLETCPLCGERLSSCSIVSIVVSASVICLPAAAIAACFRLGASCTQTVWLTKANTSGSVARQWLHLWLWVSSP